MYRIVIVLVVGLIVGSQASAATPSDRLIHALIKWESRGNDLAVGDKFRVNKQGKRVPRPSSEWAYGPLQIRQVCVDDVNGKFGTNYRAKDCLGNRELSIWICRRYIEMHTSTKQLGHAPTLEDMARIWNGGPQGWKFKRTKAYWAHVQKFL